MLWCRLLDGNEYLLPNANSMPGYRLFLLCVHIFLLVSGFQIPLVLVEHHRGALGELRWVGKRPHTPSNNVQVAVHAFHSISQPNSSILPRFNLSENLYLNSRPTYTSLSFPLFESHSEINIKSPSFLDTSVQHVFTIPRRGAGTYSTASIQSPSDFVRARRCYLRLGQRQSLLIQSSR